MTNERDDGELEPLGIDWALGERLGGERPPDLRAAVRAKLARGAMRRRPQRVLQAALMLLGLAAVCGVAFWPKPVILPTPITAPTPQEPQPTQVSSLADVAALPAGTRAVAAIGVGDAVIEALTRLRELEVLIVREPWNESYGLGLKTTAPPAPEHVTHASWRQFAKFTKLRRLELSGTVMMGQVDQGGTARSLALLECLPLLESLTLRCFDARPELLAQLPRLPNLRALDLSFNHGFLADGIESVLQCRRLRELSLRGCQQLQGDWLARLHQLTELEKLDLGLIDGMNWRSGPSFLDDTEQQVIRRAAERFAAGVNDLALAEIAKSPKLRVLDISSGRWSGKGLAELGKCTTLRDLNLYGGQERGHDFVADLPQDLERLEVCGDFTDGFCAAVREHLPKLRQLCVAACYQITDRGLADLCAMPSLRVLDMRQMRGLTAASSATIGKATQLEELDVRHDDWVTARHVCQWRRQLPKLRKVESDFSEQQIALAGALPAAEKVYSKAGIEALPADTQNVEVQNCDDTCIPALLRLTALEGLALRSYGIGARGAATVASISDDGLRELAKLPKLRLLELSGQVAILGPGIDVLRDLPELETLRLVDMLVPDQAFVGMARLGHLRTVQVVECRGFTGSGLSSLARAPALQEVSLRGCAEIQAEWLLPLVSHRELQWLDLTNTGGPRLGRRAPIQLPAPGTRVTDVVLEALGGATNLHTLKLGKAAISGAGLRHLQGLPRLRVLELDETAVSAEDLQWLPAGLEQLSLRECLQLRGAFGRTLATTSPRLLELDLSGCRDLDASLDSLAAMRSLRKLSLTSCNQGFSAKGLKHLRALTALRELNLSYCTEFTAEAADDLIALPWLEQLSLAGWKSFDTQQWNRIRAMPNLRSLQGEKFWEKLR